MTAADISRYKSSLHPHFPINITQRPPFIPPAMISPLAIRSSSRLGGLFTISATATTPAHQAAFLSVQSRSFASRSPPPPPFPVTESCPSPTCGCAATPSMPEGLEIDVKSPLNGVMSGYAEQVLVCTGRDDWPSKIEEESGGDNLAADLKELFGRGGNLL